MSTTVRPSTEVDQHVAAEVLADAFAADPWARHVLGAPGSRRPRALAAVMRVPIDVSRRRGGLIVRTDDHDRVGAVSTWVPSDRRHVATADVLRARAMTVPLAVGIPTLLRLGKDERDLDVVLAGHLQPGDAYLWVLGVRRDLHGRGLGRAVVDETCRRAAERGFRRMVLNTDNTANVPMYERLGFRLHGTSTRPAGLVAHVLIRPLDARAGDGGPRAGAR